MISAMKAMAQRFDDWTNVVLGLGGSKDASTSTRFSTRPPIDDVTLEALYVESDFAARIVEALPRETLRAGWDLALPGDPSAGQQARDLYRTREQALCVPQEMWTGSTWARDFGGAITWVGADDGQAPDKPLDETRIRTVKFLHTFDRRDVQVWSYYSDPDHPRFRLPETYRIFPQVMITAGAASGLSNAQRLNGAVVHETRVVRWNGQPTTATRRRELQGWDDSVLERCWDALKQVGEDYGAKSLLLGRISQGIYKIKNLYAMIAGGEEKVLTTRISMLDASRSRARSILLDTEEDYVNVTQPLAGVPEMIDRGILRLAMAADHPLSVLMGQAPSGANANGGASELELWTQKCEAWREGNWKPQHRRVAELILKSQDSPLATKLPENWSIAYHQFRTPTRKEVAEVRKLEAETDAINIDKGVYPAEVAAFRYGPGGQTVGITLDETELKANLDRRRDLAKQPPKDNAELGTVGARSAAAKDVVTSVAKGAMSRESGLAMLLQFFRLELTAAEAMLGPADFKPTDLPQPPGPPPALPQPGGAGRPPALPGVNDGGDPAGHTPSAGGGG